MSARATVYRRLFFWALFASLLAGVTFYDSNPAFIAIAKDKGSASVRALEEAIFNAIALPPFYVASFAGYSNFRSHVPPWPTSWPFGATLQLNLSLLVTSFWFILGVIVYELSLLVSRRRSAVRNVA